MACLVDCSGTPWTGSLRKGLGLREGEKVKMNERRWVCGGEGGTGGRGVGRGGLVW